MHVELNNSQSYYMIKNAFNTNIVKYSTTLLIILKKHKNAHVVKYYWLRKQVKRVAVVLELFFTLTFVFKVIFDDFFGQ